MPKISEAIKQGPLSGPERAIMRVIADRNEHIWSTTYEDLGELAVWEQHPGILIPENIFPDQRDPESPIVFKCWDEAGFNEITYRTYKLVTVRWALQRLAKKRLLATFKLHKRLYYGSHEAFEAIRAQMNAKDSAELQRLGFSVIPETEDVETEIPDEEDAI